jgi:hypothetical protein
MKFAGHLILALFFTVSLLFSCHRSAGKRQSPAEMQPPATPEICIKSVIALDDSLGTVRNHACEKISLA